MTTLIIISAYIVNVFLARYFNKKTYQLDEDYPITVPFWFVPVIGLACWLILFLYALGEQKSNWFSGKNW